MIRITANDNTDTGVDISAYVNLQRPGVISITQNAEEQSVANSTIVFEDPTGTLDLIGLRSVVIWDDLAPFTWIYRGQMGTRSVTRGDFRAGSKARIWTVELVDVNTFLSWRIMEAAGFNRPAETDVARMQYLLGSGIITNRVDDTTTYVDTSAPVNMDAADYRGQYVNDLINDCMHAAAKNSYLMPVTTVLEPSGYGTGIWYGPPTLTTFSSSIKISNVLADVDGSTVFAPFIDAELKRSPDRVNDGLRVNYDGGFNYQTRDATFDFYFAHRDTIYDAVNVKTAAKAAARGAIQLATMATEDDIITCTIQVASAHVNDIRAGMRVQCKFSHFAFSESGDSYDSYTYFRVLNRTVTLVSPPDATGSCLYTVALTLTPWEGIPVPPPVSCATAITGIGATLYDTGDIAIPGSPAFTVANGLVPASATQPYLAIALWDGRRTDTSCMNHGGSISVGNYTILSQNRELYPPGPSDDPGHVAMTGYYAVAAGVTPPSFIADFTPSWTGGLTGGNSTERLIAILVPTASTAPLQQTPQLMAISAGGITFPNPVSAGSLVIAAFVREGSTTTVGGWTDLGTVVMAVGSGGTQLSLFGKCMTGSEGATLTLNTASESHWWSGVEIALT